MGPNFVSGERERDWFWFCLESPRSKEHAKQTTHPNTTPHNNTYRVKHKVGVTLPLSQTLIAIANPRFYGQLLLFPFFLPSIFHPFPIATLL